VNGIAFAYLLNLYDLERDTDYTNPCPATFECVFVFLEDKRDARELSLTEAKRAIEEDM
jgi:hypothetical protein